MNPVDRPESERVPDSPATDELPDEAGAAPDAEPPAEVDGAPGEDEAAPDAAAEGDDVEVARFVDPATVRRAPKVGAFLGAGVLVGLAAGFCVGGWWLSRGAREARITVGGVEQISPVLNPGAYFALLVTVCTAIATLAAGVLAVLLDRRSLRRLERRQEGIKSADPESDLPDVSVDSQ